jgi:hypothetical protein
MKRPEAREKYFWGIALMLLVKFDALYILQLEILT